MTRRFQVRTFDVTSPRVRRDPHLHNINRKSNQLLTQGVRDSMAGSDAHLPRKMKKALRRHLVPLIAYEVALRSIGQARTQQDAQERRTAAAERARLIAPQYAANARERGDEETAAHWDAVAAGDIPHTAPTPARLRAIARMEEEHAAMTAEAAKEDYR